MARGARAGTADRGLAPGAPDAPVLLVGPEPWWAEVGLRDALAGAEWTCLEADDVARGRWLASIRRVELVLIGGDGAFQRAALDAIRASTDVPIVVLADHRADVVQLVRGGADAVVRSDEPGATILARLDAVLRRADHRREPSVRYLRSLDLVVDLWTQQCTRRGEPVDLSPTEYDLLTFMMTRPAVAIPAPTIVRRVWSRSPSDPRNAVRIAVNRLRRKLGDDAAEPAFIAAVRGSGYRFGAPVVEVADSRAERAGRVDVTPLLDSVATLASRLVGTGPAGAAEVLADELDAAGVADGLAVFRLDGERMTLVASRHMSAAWIARVAGGVPLDPSFASAHSVLTGEVVQFADLRSVRGQFGATVRQLAGEGFRACHFVPIGGQETTWGHLGLVRRSPTPLDAVTMGYLRAISSCFLLHLRDA